MNVSPAFVLHSRYPVKNSVFDCKFLIDVLNSLLSLRL